MTAHLRARTATWMIFFGSAILFWNRHGAIPLLLALVAAFAIAIGLAVHMARKRRLERRRKEMAELIARLERRKDHR